MAWGLWFAAAIAVAAVFFVARPFLREPAPASDRLDELAPDERQRLSLAEERDRALDALKELEFDHRTGKVSDDDYRAQVGPLRRRAAETLRALESRETTAMTISPNEPSTPYPPPDEGDPPTPAIVPEPTPPPDEGTPPTPAPEPSDA